MHFKVYLKFYKKFALLVSNVVKSTKENETDKALKEKTFSIVKIALIVLILFLKNPNEYSDTISDLYLVTQFKDDWQKVYVDVLISLLHKGNSKKLINFRHPCGLRNELFQKNVEVLGYANRGSSLRVLDTVR